MIDFGSTTAKSKTGHRLFRKYKPIRQIRNKMPHKNGIRRQMAPKKVMQSLILGLEQDKELEELLKEGDESEDEEMAPPDTPLEGAAAPMVFFRQHGQRHKEMHRFDLKNIGRLIKTVVEVQMLKQDKGEQRLDGLDKTWALERLEHLSLVQLELKKIDPRIGKMTCLYTCDFSNNHLHDKSFPPEIANCERLRHIKVNDNRLTTIPEELTLVKNLTKLDARQNRICCIRGLKKFSQLEGANLSYNRLLLFDLGINSEESVLKYLEYINCSHNHITGIVTDLTNLSKLEEINLSFNGLRYLNASLLQSQTLAKIYLGSNYIFKIQLPRQEGPAIQTPTHPPPTTATRRGPAPVVEKKELHPPRFIDLSNNFLTHFPHAIPTFVDDVNLTRNWLRFIPSSILKELKKTMHKQEVDITSNPLSCFYGATLLSQPQKHATAQNIIAAMRLLRYLCEYDEPLENCLYRGMKLVVLGATGAGKKEFVSMFMSEQGNEFRQRILEHSLRQRNWLNVHDYYLNVYFGLQKSRQKQPQQQTSQQLLQRPADHRIVHSSLWKFSGSIRNANLDYVFIRHEQMIVNLVVDLKDYSTDFQYEILGLWLDMVMTHSSNSCIIIPVGMFAEELPGDKAVTAYSHQIEKYLSSFLIFREKEYKQMLEEVETIGETRLSLVGAAKLKTLRAYKSRLPLIHENLVKINQPGAKGINEYLNLLKAAAFHPNFYGNYVTLSPSNLLDCHAVIEGFRYTMEVPMMQFREFSGKIRGACGGGDEAVLEMTGHLHEYGKIFWFGKNRMSGDHGDDIVFIDVQWLVDALYCLLDRETVQQMAAQVKKTKVFDDVDFEQCQIFLEKGIMSTNILKRLWKSIMPDYTVKQETLQQLIVTLLVSFKIGYPTLEIDSQNDPNVTPKGKFLINIDTFKVEWASSAGRDDSSIQPTNYQIPCLIDSSIPMEAENYLKGFGLLDDSGGGGGGKGQRPEILGAEFYFPVFCPRGLFARVVSHLAQVLRSMFFASLWQDGLWARSGDGTCGLYLERIDKESFKTGPAPSDRVALRLFLIDLNAKSGEAHSICNKLWTVFITILKETESIFLWYPGLFYLSNSLCPHCRNPACPAEWHDGRELASSKGHKCKSCNKEVQVYYLVKTL